MWNDLFIILGIILLAVLVVQLSHILEKMVSFIKGRMRRRFKMQFYAELKKINLQNKHADTHLTNEEVFKNRLEQIINLCERFEICFCLIRLEINHFNDLEEKLNPAKRKKLLSIAKHRLKNILRKVDTIELVNDHSFLILLPMKYKIQNAAHIAHRLQKSMLIPFLIQDEVFSISTHIGIAIYPDDGIDLNELLQSVKEATQFAKQLGENRYHFHEPAMQKIHNHESMIALSLQHESALESLIIRTQTYRNIQTNQLEYIYLLPCIFHKTLGMVELTHYPHAAALAGKSLEIFEKLMLHAIRQICEWKTAWPSIQSFIIPITLSQIQNSEHIHKLHNLINEYNINTKSFIFDISAIDNSLGNVTLKNLTQMLNENNLQISLSLFLFSQLPISEISKLPIHLLKIDSLVLESMQNNRDNIPLIKMITSIATESDIKLLAEKHHSKKVNEILRELSCQLFYEDSIDVPLNGSSLMLYQEKIKHKEKT